jgi:hypothetical protein
MSYPGWADALAAESAKAAIPKTRALLITDLPARALNGHIASGHSTRNPAGGLDQFPVRFRHRFGQKLLIQFVDFSVSMNRLWAYRWSKTRSTDSCAPVS